MEKRIKGCGLGITGLLVLLLLCPVLAGAGITPVTKTVTAQNTFTDAIEIQRYGTVRISGTFEATISLQRSDDGGSTWVDTGDTWTAGGIYTFTDHTKQLYRVGVKTGQFTSGSVLLWLGSGN